MVGHSHTYGWTYPLTGHSGNEATFVADEDKVYAKGAGVVQVISGAVGGGSGLRSGTFDYPYVARGFSLSTSPQAEVGFAQVHVSPGELRVDYVAASDGDVIDSFRITDAPETTETLIFRNGTGGYSGVQDTHLREASDDSSYGDSASVNVDGADDGGEVQGLLRFDGLFGGLDSQIAPGDTIVSATLRLDVFNPGDAFALHEMRTAWTEGSTWSDFGAGVQADGVEAAATPVHASGFVSTGLRDIDVTDSVAAWLADPDDAHGWVFLPTGDNGVDFRSGETSDGPRLTVVIERAAANRAPVALDDDAATDEDAPVAINPLINDTDPDDDPLTIIEWTQGAHGAVTLADGALLYTPAADFNGADSFGYTVSDGELTASATVSVTVDPVNDAPVAVDDARTMTAGDTLTLDPLANDTDVEDDPLDLTGWTQGAHGVVTLVGDDLRYAPEAGFSGEDSFTYVVSDGQATDTGLVTVTVEPATGSPTAVDDAYGLSETDYAALGGFAGRIGRPADGTGALSNDATTGASAVSAVGGGAAGDWVDGDQGGEFRITAAGRGRLSRPRRRHARAFGRRGLDHQRRLHGHRRGGRRHRRRQPDGDRRERDGGRRRRSL